MTAGSQCAEGLEQAAKDDDIQLNYVSTGVFASEDEEKAADRA